MCSVLWSFDFFFQVWFPRWQGLVIASKVWEENAGSDQSIN